MRQWLINFFERVVRGLRGPSVTYPAAWLADLFRRQPACAQEEHDACGCALMEHVRTKRNLVRDMMETKYPYREEL